MRDTNGCEIDVRCESRIFACDVRDIPLSKDECADSSNRTDFLDNDFFYFLFDDGF
jgi:hypothetical protein